LIENQKGMAFLPCTSTVRPNNVNYREIKDHQECQEAINLLSKGGIFHDPNDKTKALTIKPVSANMIKTPGGCWAGKVGTDDFTVGAFNPVYEKDAFDPDSAYGFAGAKYDELTAICKFTPNEWHGPNSGFDRVDCSQTFLGPTLYEDKPASDFRDREHEIMMHNGDELCFVDMRDGYYNGRVQCNPNTGKYDERKASRCNEKGVDMSLGFEDGPDCHTGTKAAIRGSDGDDNSDELTYGSGNCCYPVKCQLGFSDVHTGSQLQLDSSTNDNISSSSAEHDGNADYVDQNSDLYLKGDACQATFIQMKSELDCKKNEYAWTNGIFGKMGSTIYGNYENGGVETGRANNEQGTHWECKACPERPHCEMSTCSTRNDSKCSRCLFGYSLTANGCTENANHGVAVNDFMYGVASSKRPKKPKRHHRRRR